MGPSPHHQRRGNPLERHGRFGSQSPRYLHFANIPFAQLVQARLRPSPPLEFLPHDPPRSLLRRFLPLGSVVVAPHLPLRRFQQFLPKGFVPQIPSPPQPLPFLSSDLHTALFHPPLKLPPTRRTVLWDAHLTQQPLHPQPSRTSPRWLQILNITAPRIFPELLFRPEQF